MTTLIKPRRAQDQGSIMVLSLGFVIICVLAVGVVVDVTSVFIARRSLQAALDAAALAGAQGIDLPSYYARGAADGVVLNPGAVRARVSTQLQATPEVRLVAVRLENSTVVVRGSTSVRPPLSGWLTPGGSRTLTAVAGAELVYRPGNY